MDETDPLPEMCSLGCRTMETVQNLVNLKYFYILYGMWIVVYCMKRTQNYSDESLYSVYMNMSHISMTTMTPHGNVVCEF
jgi:hypothetical protein